jgi:tetratricopeptide (TPR) repeat protein
MMAIVSPPEEQIEWNERALEMCERTPDPRAAKWKGSLYNNLGWTYHDMGRLEDALSLFERGVDFRVRMGQEEPLRIAKWCVARCHRSLGRTEEALAGQEALLSDMETAGRTDMYVLEEMGECLHALGRESEAKPWFARAHAEMSKDPWLVENEPVRLDRLKELAK